MEKKRSKSRLYILWFVLPAFLLYTLFMIIPLFTSMYQSLYVYNDARELVFSGLENYIKLFTDEMLYARFINAMGNSFKFFLINMFIQNPIALLLATLLATNVKFGNGYRTVLYIPCVLSLVMVAFIWQMILNPTWGIAKDFLGIFGLAHVYSPWLGQKNSALIVMALISAWQNMGVPVLLYYSALINIPQELLNAAKVEGCNSFSLFWKIKIPMVMPMISTVSLLTYVYNFNAFDLIYAIKGPLAGPDFSTDTMMSFFFRTFYGHELQQPNAPMGATLAVVMLLVLLVGVAVYIVWNRWANRKLN